MVSAAFFRMRLSPARLGQSRIWHATGTPFGTAPLRV
jgi:hypothetical protein